MKQSKALSGLIKDFNRKRDLGAQNLAKIIKVLSPFLKGKKKILDLGCGPGRILIPLAFHFPKTNFVGLDVSRKAIGELLSRTETLKIKNIIVLEKNFNENDWDKLLEIRSFDAIFLFQAIHFVKNIPSMIFKIRRLLRPGGFVVVGTTLHRQFYELPYCLTFPKALKIELSRTPDLPKIKNKFKKINFSLIKKTEIKILKKFKNSAQLKKWLLQYPYSVLLLIKKEELKKGIKKFIERYKPDKPILVDKFSVLIFRNINYPPV